MAPGASGATERIAEFARSNPEVSRDRPALVARILVDTFGAALAASGTDTEQIIRRWANRERTSGAASMWNTGEQVSPSLAAFCNGTLGHVLDWDDVSPSMPMHPSTVLIPALLAVAEHERLSGAALVRAYDAGAATFRAVAEALPHTEHYRRGWHTTSTVGRLAATAALINLKGLNSGQARTALGIVASFGAGSLSNSGTMTKSLHAGAAARDAVVAVDLATDGFTANASELEQTGGFFEVYGDSQTQDLSSMSERLERWRRDWPDDWALKLHPSCYATHRAIDAAFAVRRRLEGARPRSVHVTVAPGGLRPLLDHAPMTPNEAKFSMAFVIATALIHGEVRLRHFTDSFLRDPDICDLMTRVTTSESERPPRGSPADGDFAVVQADVGGQLVAERVDVTLGDFRNPLSDAQVEAKLRDGAAVAGLRESETRCLIDELVQMPTSTAPVSLPVLSTRKDYAS